MFILLINIVGISSMHQSIQCKIRKNIYIMHNTYKLSTFKGEKKKNKRKKNILNKEKKKFAHPGAPFCYNVLSYFYW